MPHVASEIVSQPECWERAARLSAESASFLPRDGARVAAVGCGTSYNIAQVYAGLRESAGCGETDAFSASSFPAHRPYDHVVFFSRTGTTTEVVAAIDRTSRGVATTSVVAEENTPVAKSAGAVIVLDFANEQAVVQTRFATSAIVLLRSCFGADVAPLVAAAREAIATPIPKLVSSARQFTFLGLGWATGLAHEAALKLRETAQVWAESYPAMEYRHGPISVAEPGSVIWSLGPAPEGMAEQVAATGATWIASSRDPLVELLIAQRLAVDLALGKGLDPDRPRHLTRSIVLDT